MQKLLVLLILSLELFGWYFDQDTIKNWSPSQLRIVQESLLAGDQYHIGEEVATLVILESRVGNFEDKTDNRICGVHQMDVINLARRYTGTNRKRNIKSYKSFCKVIEQNTMYSALLATQEYLEWYKLTGDYNKAALRYNRGYLKSKHDVVFLRRFKKVKREIEIALLNGTLKRLN